MKILAVDDDTIALDMLVLALAQAGHKDVTTCTAPIEALRTLERGDIRFDCLLLDIQMPNVDGIELCAKIRGLPDYQDTPVIMLTAMLDKSYIERAFYAGATDYITKPFDPFEIGARVRVADKMVSLLNRPTPPPRSRTIRHADQPNRAGSCITRQEITDLFMEELRYRDYRAAV